MTALRHQLAAYRFWLGLCTTLLAALIAGCGAAPTAGVAGTTTATAIQPGLMESSPTLAVSPTGAVPVNPLMATPFSPTKTLIPTLAPSPTLTPAEGQPATVSVQVADVWDDPAHEKDYWSRQTQLITGERVRVLEEAGDWDRIVAVEQPTHKDPRGYPGWVRRDSLVAGWVEGDSLAVVMVALSAARSQPDRQAGIVMWLPFDARLALSQVKGGWLELALPDRRLVWIPQQDARLIQDPPQLDTIYAAAQSFLTVPYLWGGTASGALDCSGFLYRLFHAYGITLPRDADDQALAGVAVPGEPQRGDLIFTSEKKGGPVTHVVMVWAGKMIIDADSPKGLTIHPFGDVLRTGYQVSVRRILP